MTVAVLGASGFVGQRLVPVLRVRGHDVVALTRRPNAYGGPGPARYADLDDPASLTDALSGVSQVYYLAHALGRPDFAEQEARHARALALAASASPSTIGQVVYLSGLGGEGHRLSPHLASRRTVEAILSEGRPALTVLRAGIIVGAGSTGWEMLRQSLDALPLLVADRRARTRHQPIGVDDAIGYLADVLGRADCQGETIEIGGGDVLRYRDMIQRLARLTGRLRPVVEVPWLPDPVAARAIDLLTTVRGPTALDLLRSIGTETIVTTERAQTLLPRRVLGFEAAARQALANGAAPPWFPAAWASLASEGVLALLGKATSAPGSSPASWRGRAPLAEEAAVVARP